MPKAQRKGEGQPLRDAMKRQGLTGPEVSAATKEADLKGKGVSPALVGRLMTRGKTARERCMQRSAELIAEVLHEDPNDLFVMPPHSTVKVERSSSHAEEE